MLAIAILMMLVIAFLPPLGRHLFALFSVLISAGLFYTIFVLWHWSPPDNALYSQVAAHWWASANHGDSPSCLTDRC